MYKLVDTVVEIMKDSYPKLLENKSYVKGLVLEEENLFHQTLRAGERKPYAKMLELRKKHYFCKNNICNEVFSIRYRPAEA